MWRSSAVKCDDLLSIVDDEPGNTFDDNMAASVPFEISKFNRNVRYIRRILRDTQQTYDEIRNGGTLYDDQIHETQLTAQDLEQLNRIIDSKVSIVVLGQSCYAKACVTNELFNKQVLPVVQGPDGGDRGGAWRMVRFRYGTSNQISISLPNSYELIEHLQAFEQSWWAIPKAELDMDVDERSDGTNLCNHQGQMHHDLDDAVLEIRFKHSLLKEDTQVVVTPSNHPKANFGDILESVAEDTLPIFIYAISCSTLSEQDTRDLVTLKSMRPKDPVFFIRVPDQSTADLTESEQHVKTEIIELRRKNKLKRNESSEGIFQQLCDLGFLSSCPAKSKRTQNQNRKCRVELESEFVEYFECFSNILLFTRHVLQSYLVTATTVLCNVHTRCLHMFINVAFDMARDMLITPKRIEYARKKENELYESLLEIANRKQDEIRDLIVETISSMREYLIDKAANHQFTDFRASQSIRMSTTKELQACTGEIQDLVLGTLNNAVAAKLVDSVECLHENVIGTLQRCLEGLEKCWSIDCPESLHASLALREILNAAYQVEMTVKTSSTFARVLWEKMKQLIHSVPWKAAPRIDVEWKMKVAAEMIDSLSEWRLAKSICAQFRERLRYSHEEFAISLRQLECLHSGRLEKTEEQRLKVRRIHSPKIARYALESTSLRDMVLYGMPPMGKEIGRGQYGVVYACESWGGFAPCALKSVVPPDEKHWNDLALEFHYTRSVPEHERIVALRGSVIDHSYAGGSPAVILIMERLHRDLYTAIRTGLEWSCRLQIAIDVIQGIRFLHSQGLVHRDIKLKNVLLDIRNRAKLTDLGFCKPEAMMSGSIVGTPIHMAPELFSGKYDHRVDVYAFGVLFWYICAGNVRLPTVYEMCQNKDQLWTDVKKGARPERLPQFTDECWSIMDECWAGDPMDRPLLGDVELRLGAIVNHFRSHPVTPSQDFHEREVDVDSLSCSPYIDVDFQHPM